MINQGKMRFLGVFLSFLWCACIAAKETRPIYSEIIYDLQTNRIIHRFKIDQKTQPASLTKMMTLYITFSKIKNGELKLTDKIVFSTKAAEQHPSILGLKAGETLTIQEAILALITKSANDVAVALAEKISGSEESFVQLMNFYCRQLKMFSTTFQNASGWKNKKQLTTARDMTKLSIALLKDCQSFYPLFSTKSFLFCGRKYNNHNNLLKHVPKNNTGNEVVIDGIKTGYVAASGYNLAASARDKNGRRIIAVILGGPTAKWRDERMASMIEAVFNNQKPGPPKIEAYYNNNLGYSICSKKRVPSIRLMKQKTRINRILSRLQKRSLKNAKSKKNKTTKRPYCNCSGNG